MSTSSADGGRVRSTPHAVLVVALLLPAVYLLTEGVASAAVFLLAALLPPASIAVTLAVRRPAHARPWWWALGATLCLTVDAAVWLLQTADPSLPTSLVLVAQAAVALGYVGLLVATVLLVLPAVRDDGGTAIDSAIVALAAAVLVWAFVVDPALAGRTVSTVDRTVALVGLLVVSGIAGATVRAVIAAEHARRTLGYLVLAAVSSIVANIAMTVHVDERTGAEEPWVGALWIVSNVALAAAATRPRDLALAPSTRPRTQRLTTAHLAFLAVALALNPLLAVAREVVGREADLPLLSAGTLVLVPLVLARVEQLARLQTRTEQELAHQATHDALTGLPNRRAADQHLKETVRLVAEEALPGALLCFLDLDNFKDVNDEHGHHVGDRLLVAVADRLRTVVRTSDFVARFGGDEFIVIVVGDPDVLRSETVTRIREALSTPVQLGSITAPAAASIGTAAVRLGNALSGEQLTSIADARMYAEKRRDTRDASTAPA